MTKDMLGVTDVKGPITDLFEKLGSPDGERWLDELKRFLRRENPFVETGRHLSNLIRNTQKLLSKRFGKKIAVDPLPTEFTKENLRLWSKYNLKPVFFPDEEIGEDRNLKDWIKPKKWFYQKIREEKISSDSAMLKKGWYLADFSVGVDYTDGSQVFPNDPLAPIIERLRKEGKIGKYDQTPQGSRFAIVPQNEWPLVLAELAKEIGIDPENIRLERTVEFNAIGNLYDENRGKFNMWEWFSDPFAGSSRLCGGSRGSGGLSNVRCGWSDRRYGSIAGRPLVSFKK